MVHRVFRFCKILCVSFHAVLSIQVSSILILNHATSSAASFLKMSFQTVRSMSYWMYKSHLTFLFKAERTILPKNLFIKWERARCSSDLILVFSSKGKQLNKQRTFSGSDYFNPLGF